MTAATSATRACASSSSRRSSTSATSRSSPCSSSSASARSSHRRSRSCSSRRRTSSATSSGRFGDGADASSSRWPARPSSAAMFVSSAGAADAKARLTKDRAIAIFLANDKVADWLDRYPKKGRVTDATYESDAAKCTDAQAAAGRCTSGGARTSRSMPGRSRRARSTTRRRASRRRGRARRSRGRWPAATTAPSAARRSTACRSGSRSAPRFCSGSPTSGGRCRLRNLDLLALLSFSVSLWFFNDGNIFTSVPLAYPPLVYLLARMRLDRRARPSGSRSRAGLEAGGAARRARSS